MDSDDYFDDLDSAFLQEVDALEAKQTNAQLKPRTPTRPAQPRPPSAKRPPRSDIIEIDDSDDFGSFAIDEEDLRRIDKITNDAFQSRAPSAGRSGTTFARTNSRATVQTTLDGSILPKPSKDASSSRQPIQRSGSNVFNGASGPSRRTKQWDHTAFAKSGWKKPQTAKGKEREFGSFDDEAEEDFEEEPEEFEQFPAPFVPIGPPPPMKLEADRLAARRWIYPLNQSRRDYQFNIVKKCLFDNTLVALPTGLGKTFIAGVVMLNFYTWFPEGKVVFVAPTKPLVAQQIEACHRTCGIPGSDAVELTGQNPRPVRARAWQEKRVFYMTPQTLMNDLKSSNCDPQDIVLLVIDEAHKGTGDYAYAQVIRYLMAKNPHFRVLALTATPGGKPEAVQAVVDALHISHIEIRDERSLDLAPYLYKKHVEKHIIAMSKEIVMVRDMLAEVMMPMIQRLFNAKLLAGNPNPVSLHPFSCRRSMQMLASRPNERHNNQWAFGMLSKLGSLARIMGYLIEGSISQCHASLSDFVAGTNIDTPAPEKPTSSKSKPKKPQKDPKLLEILQELDTMRIQSGGFPLHPKMDKMKTLLVEHFAQKRFDKDDAVANGGGEDFSGDSRVMIFVSFRQGVEEVVSFLNEDKPLIRAVPFIGQGTDKQGKKGYGQKEQLEVIKRFKAGEFNVLVSTSIGEEGLDIGEIDMIICYDSQKTPIRMLQRIGRTGRKREGYVHVLLSEDREERNWDKADDNYKDVQQFIIKAEQLELYDDVERLIPDNIKPECIEMTMDIEEYVREDPNSKKGLKTAKRVRNDDVMRNIPTGASTSFVSVKDLLQKGKKRKKTTQFDEDAGEDDSDDQQIAAGITANYRRTLSMPDSTSRTKKKLRRTATAPKSSIKARTTKKQSPDLKPPPKDFDEANLDDSDDEAISGGLFTTAKAVMNKTSTLRKIAVTSETQPDSPPHTPPRSKQQKVSIEILSSPDRPLSGQLADEDDHDEDEDKDDEDFSVQAISRPQDLADVSVIDLTTPAQRGGSPELRRSSSEPVDDEISSAQSPSAQVDSSMAWLLDDDEEPAFGVVGSSPLLDKAKNMPNALDDGDSEPEIVNESQASHSSQESHVLRMMDNEVIHRASHSRGNNGRGTMAPPALPARFRAVSTLIPSPSRTDNHETSSPPPSTFAVRGPGAKQKKTVHADSFDSSPLIAAPSKGRRLHRQRSQEFFEPSASPKPAKKKKRKFADVIEAQRHNPWIDVEASHSGDEYSAGSDGEDAMSDSDRHFIAENPTQAPPSYDQSAVYRRSLMTQLPSGSMPVFANRPYRRGGAAYGAFSRPPQKAQLSSSPPRELGSDDYYEHGSFVVDDDAEISYADDSHILSDL